MHMTVAESLLVTILGIGVVFIVLIILNVMIKGLSVLAISVDKRAARMAAVVQGPAPASPARAGMGAPDGAIAAYPGTGPGVRLYDIDVKTAAMVMAVVAHQTSIPIGELRFRSIRAVG
jgi:Na+-transporting methylmalonyl-CoA/oxaloacetate decarboxylase gamma subunit